MEETNNRVLYRVTPIFEGDNLVAKGVEMEAWSVEDKGEGICFNVFCYNVQPGICSSVNSMSEKNKQIVQGMIDNIKGQGYMPCSRCLGMYK